VANSHLHAGAKLPQKIYLIAAKRLSIEARRSAQLVHYAGPEVKRQSSSLVQV
jgi:hypothetical protein